MSSLYLERYDQKRKPHPLHSPTYARALNNDPIEQGRKIASFVKANHLDGVDVDYEEVKGTQLDTASASNLPFHLHFHSLTQLKTAQ